MELNEVTRAHVTDTGPDAGEVTALGSENGVVARLKLHQNLGAFSWREHEPLQLHGCTQQTPIGADEREGAVVIETQVQEASGAAIRHP